MSAHLLDEKTRSLSVEIPSTYLNPTSASSVDSSNTSPTGILDSRSRSTSASTSSLPGPVLNVTFAPLPKLAPRKRRSAAPLGMAARGQLVRRRRFTEMQTYQNPMWTDEEIAEQQRVAAGEIVRRQGQEEGEDPFQALGKLVKVASKNIWRKVSNKDLSRKGKDEGKKAAAVEGEQMPLPETQSVPRQTPVMPAQNGEEGSSDSNHDDDERFLSVGQTETIVEGRTKYSWIKGSLEGSEGSSAETEEDGVTIIPPIHGSP